MQVRLHIGIVGSGMIGGTLGRLWLDAGHEVRYGARDVEKTRASADPRAWVGPVADAAKWAEAMFLAVPLKAVDDVVAQIEAHVAGKAVLDAGNAVSKRDGAVATEAAAMGSGAWLARKLPGAHVVKAFNTVYFQTIAHAKQKTPPVAVPLCGDDARALAVAEQLVRDAGLEPVLVGGLDQSKRIDFGSPVWNTNMDAAQLRQALGL